MSKKIRVGMDISQTAYIGGVSTYTQELASQLLSFEDLEMVFFYSSLRRPYSGTLPHVRTSVLPPSVMEVLFNYLRMPSIDLFLDKLDVFHSSDWTQPKSRAKKVTTYHDLIPVKFPEWSDPKIVRVHQKRLELVSKEVDIIIAVSESTKRDLLELSVVDEDRVVVIYEGVSEIFKPQSQGVIGEFKKKLRLPDKFILTIGGVGNRRNIERVKEAVGSYPLVITTEIKPQLSYEEMPLLYSSAQLLLYPSLYEGFGLPVLEAMACGTPVITSNISSLPEVGGEAVVYVNPLDVKDIREKVEEVVSNKNFGEQLVKLGYQQAKRFSWGSCAKKTAEIYRRLLK